MKSAAPFYHVALGLSLTALVGCSSSKFAASNTAKTDTAPSGSPQAADAQANAPLGQATDHGDSNAPVISDTNDCSTGAPLSYNIMMIFDNTGSQLKTDPDNVRRAGGVAFVDQFAAYAAANAHANIYMGVLSFNRSSIRSAHGWLLLTPDHVNAVKQDIVGATTNPSGDTAYSPVLTDAGLFFDQINGQTKGTNARNYVVFLTDGEPNADPGTGVIMDAVNKLVAKNVGMITIASGPDVSAAGEVTLKALALPLKGTQHADVVGQYYRATTPDDLKTVWSSLQNKIAACGKPT